MSFTRVEIIGESFTQEKDVRTGKRIWRCSAADTTESCESAMTASDGTTSVASIGDYWSGTTLAKCKSKSAERVNGDSQDQFDVTCDFTTASDAQTIENPLARPVKFDYGGSGTLEPYFRDAAGDPVVTSAGNPFEQMPQRFQYDGTITITRNVAAYNDATAESYRNKVNSDTVTLNGTAYTAKQLLLVNWTASGPNVENDITFWTETIEIAKRIAGWDQVYEDRDTQELDGAGGLKPILDATHQPVAAPWSLDGSGAAKASPTDAPATLTFVPYAAVAFASL